MLATVMDTHKQFKAKDIGKFLKLALQCSNPTAKTVADA